MLVAPHHAENAWDVHEQGTERRARKRMCDTTPHLMVVSTATATVPEMGHTAMADGFITLGRRYTVTAADNVLYRNASEAK